MQLRRGLPDRGIPVPTHLTLIPSTCALQAAPINPADLATCRTGGTYGEATVATPFVPGHDGVGLVVKARLLCLWTGAQWHA